MLMSFYQQGRNEGKFDTGIEMALAAHPGRPRVRLPQGNRAGQPGRGQNYRISDLELASRLSFFLWSSIPDDELINLASSEQAARAGGAGAAGRRMLADPRSDQLVVNFAGQWLNLRGMQTVFPIPGLFPDFDDNLRAAMRKETELFVGSIVHEDRSVMDLLNGNYTFLNERLAKHYGIPNVYGSNFRRVELPPEFDMRRGLLGKGSARDRFGVSQPDLAHGARQDHDADFPGREPARSAAQRSDVERRRQRDAFAHQADHAPADGDASRQ